MSKDKQTTHVVIPLKKGYQPSDAPPNPQGGYQPATGQGAPANPPNKGTGGKK